MRMIQSKYITLSWILLSVSALCMYNGFYNHIWFVLAALFLGLYIFVHIKFLRCPHCGKFVNLDRLTYARKHKYFCNFCGNEIKVE